MTLPNLKKFKTNYEMTVQASDAEHAAVLSVDILRKMALRPDIGVEVECEGHSHYFLESSLPQLVTAPETPVKLPKLNNLTLKGGDNQEALVPAEDDRRIEVTNYQPIYVTIDGLTDPVLAYSDGSKWNGFECPHFPVESVGEIVNAFKSSQEIVLDFVDDQRLYKVGIEHDMSQAECMLGTDILVDGKLIDVWPIGSHEWCWEKVDPPTHYQMHTSCCGAPVELRLRTNLIHLESGLFDAESAYVREIGCSDCGTLTELDECSGKKMVIDPRDQ